MARVESFVNHGLTAPDRSPDGMPRCLTRAEPLRPEQHARLRNRRILMPLASSGHVAQEALKPAACWMRAGCEVVFATCAGGDVSFDPLCNAVAWGEMAWDPTLRLLGQASREGWFADMPSLRRLDAEGTLPGWLDGFDAIVVPGGHGRVFSEFIHDPLIVDTVARFHATGRVVGLICHAPMAAALPSAYGPGFIRNKTVACWPRGIEKMFSLLPALRHYLVPFGRPVGHFLEGAGAEVHDSILPWRAVHAVVDGNLVTGRGPWSTHVFASALLHLLAAAPDRTTEAEQQFAPDTATEG